NVVESERAHGPLIGSETDCVQGPLMLSETCTWPGALYWPNHPISRSPARTGLLRVYVYEARRSAGGAAAPWTNSGERGGVEAGRGGGGHGRRAGNGVEDGAHRVPAVGGAEGGRPLLGARRARRDVLFERGAVGSLRPRRVRYAGAASGRHRAGGAAGQQG